MMESIYSFFANIFDNNVILATLLISMLPIVELKGGISFAVNEILWSDSVLSLWESFGWSVLGCSILVPFLALLYRPIIRLMKKVKGLTKIGGAIENFILSKSSKTENNGSASKFRKILFVFLFVAIPLPLTGVWTGTCIAVCMNLDFLTTCITVILGNIVAGLIIALILQFFPILNNYLFFILLAFVAIYFIIKLIRHLTSNKTNQMN